MNPPSIAADCRIEVLAAVLALAADLGATALEVESLYTEAVARKADGVMSEAARRLDVTFNTVSARLRRARHIRSIHNHDERCR